MSQLGPNIGAPPHVQGLRAGPRQRAVESGEVCVQSQKAVCNAHVLCRRGCVVCSDVVRCRAATTSAPLAICVLLRPHAMSCPSDAVFPAASGRRRCRRSKASWPTPVLWRPSSSTSTAPRTRSVHSPAAHHQLLVPCTDERKRWVWHEARGSALAMVGPAALACNACYAPAVSPPLQCLVSPCSCSRSRTRDLC